MGSIPISSSIVDTRSSLALRVFSLQYLPVDNIRIFDILKYASCDASQHRPVLWHGQFQTGFAPLFFMQGVE